MGAAAVYARKSTDQAVSDEEKSVTRQVELAVACARTHGFEVPPEHIYVDDAISGAEFDRRPGLMRLLNTLRPKARFAGLFLADKDRLGREQFETNHILKQISVAGVRIFEYQNGGQEVRLESPMDKLIMSVSNFAAELERAKASQRTRDALQLKAQRGYVVGGTVFGYRNVPVVDQGGQRSHVVREIREDEAATVRHIFSLAAGGTGLRTIARALNAEGVRSPRARAGRHHSWAPSSVRSVLFNSLYKGEGLWRRTKKRDAWGRRKESDRPTNEWVITRAEHLRIVSDDLWAKGHEALQSRQKAYGFKRGSPRPVGALDSKYLLTGMVECGVCGGRYVQTRNCRKPADRLWYNHSRGRAGCADTLRVEMHPTHDPVLQAVTRDVLDPEVVREAPHLAPRHLEQPPPRVAARLDTLKNELARLEVELNRYAEAVADAGPLETLLQAVQVREHRRDGIRSGLKTLTTQRRVEPRDTSDIPATFVNYLGNRGVIDRRGRAGGPR